MLSRSHLKSLSLKATEILAGERDLNVNNCCLPSSWLCAYMQSLSHTAHCESVLEKPSTESGDGNKKFFLIPQVPIGSGKQELGGERLCEWPLTLLRLIAGSLAALPPQCKNQLDGHILSITNTCHALIPLHSERFAELQNWSTLGAHWSTQVLRPHPRCAEVKCSTLTPPFWEAQLWVQRWQHFKWPLPLSFCSSCFLETGSHVAPASFELATSEAWPWTSDPLASSSGVLAGVSYQS